jgi:hypothetical protein
MMRTINAPATARLLDLPVKQQTARAYARTLTAHARAL